MFLMMIGILLTLTMILLVYPCLNDLKVKRKYLFLGEETSLKSPKMGYV